MAFKTACFVTGIACCLLSFAYGDTGEQDGSAEFPRLDAFRPQWEVGQRWTVKTTALQSPSRSNVDKNFRGPQIHWQFVVKAVQRVAGQECLRLEVRPQTKSTAKPRIVLWVEKDSLALVRFEAQVPIQGAFRTITENYRFLDERRSPVLGPLTVIPIDLPIFLPDEAKSTGRFAYQAFGGPPGEKAVGDVSFAYEVEQQIGPSTAGHVKELTQAEFAKDLVQQPLAHVELKGAHRRVRQLWRAGSPWPVYSENGTTSSQLVQVLPAKRP